MAISSTFLDGGRWRQAANRSSQEWLETGIRTALLFYISIVALLHMLTVPKIYEFLSSPCEPSSCFWGQLHQGPLDRLADRGISPEMYAIFLMAQVLMIPVIGHLLALIVVWQRPTNWLPVLFVMAIATCTIGASGALWIVMFERPHWETPLQIINIPMMIAWPLMPLLFPDGRFVPKWLAVSLLFVAADIFFMFNQERYHASPDWFQRLYEPWAMVLGTIAIIWRLRTTTDRRKRRQVQIWFAGLTPLWLYSWFIYFFAREDSPATKGTFVAVLDQFVWAIGILIFLIGFLMAIYLFNVYDLSIVIRRSIVYGALTVALVVVYLATVAVVSTLVQSDESAVPAMLATIVIALGFAPLRNWLQRRVRDLLYGDETDPYGVLTRFGQHLESAPPPERLLISVVELAQDALRVPGVSLAVAGAPELSVRTGSLAYDAVAIPVRYQGEAVGELAVAPRGPAEAFSPSDRRLIEEIARQTGIAVHSTLLSESLKQSREQIVTAREEERRRIRNDLHDGLGPALAALSLQVEIARDLIETDPDRTTKLLEDVLDQTRESILDIRRLVYDLRPPALDDLGLAGAIRAQAARWEEQGFELKLELDEELPPLTAATEVALLRISQEALANVAKHARATSVTLRLQIEKGVVRLEIVDDGRGMTEGERSGVGMRSMRERAEELGGRFSVSNRPGGGLTVVAEFDLVATGAGHR